MKKLITVLLLTLPLMSWSASLKSLNQQKPPFKLPKLGYDMAALEPSIDKTTMEIHHGKHHQAYVDKANAALTDSKSNLLDLMKTMSQQSDAVRNNAGGHWNHSFFWTVMTGDKKAQQMPKKLEADIVKTFGSVDQFKEAFEKAATGLFGSGWTWLIRDTKGELKITTTINQDNPLMDIAKEQGQPILGLDVWEHAYYLTYQNKRADYAKKFWSIVNWEQVAEYDKEVKK